MNSPQHILKLITSGEYQKVDDQSSAMTISIQPSPPHSGEFDGFFTISVGSTIPANVLTVPQVIIQYEGQQPFEEFTAWFANNTTKSIAGKSFGPYLLYSGLEALEKNRQGLAINVTILVVVNDAPMPFIYTKKFTENLWPQSL